MFTTSTVTIAIGLAGCIGGRATDDSGQVSPPNVEWETSEGHTKAHGGDWFARFTHEGGDEIDTTESTIEPFHTDDISVDFMNHESGTTYSRGDEFHIVVDGSSSDITHGEMVGITWTTADITDWYTIAKHEWGENY